MLVNCIILICVYIFYLLFFYIVYTIRKNKQVKGNINKKGEKIYYTKDHRLYQKVKAEEYFKNEKEAEKAGYRKPKR